MNVEISVPIISTACSFDAIGLRAGRSVVPDDVHSVNEFQVDRRRESAVPRIYKVVPTNYVEDNIASDDDLVAVPNAIVVGALLIAQ
jgi:hypothetical protein